jgi:hypothetical protein
VGRCLAAFVVNVDAEDPLSAVFTVDAVIFQPPQKIRDKWEKANTRPGSVRWANNMQHAEVSAENKNLTWHYPGQACLPAVVLEMAQQGSSRERARPAPPGGPGARAGRRAHRDDPGAPQRPAQGPGPGQALVLPAHQSGRRDLPEGRAADLPEGVGAVYGEGRSCWA